MSMVSILPLMSSRVRLRTWAAVMGASVAAWFVPYGHAPSYLAIDLAAAAIVLFDWRGFPVRHPWDFHGWQHAQPVRLLGQRVVAGFCLLMVMFHIGFLLRSALNDGPGNVAAYVAANNLLGWGQWATLLVWGGCDVLDWSLRHWRAGRRPLASSGGDG